MDETIWDPLQPRSLVGWSVLLANSLYFHGTLGLLRAVLGQSLCLLHLYRLHPGVS